MELAFVVLVVVLAGGFVYLVISSLPPPPRLYCPDGKPHEWDEKVDVCTDGGFVTLKLKGRSQ